MSGTVFVQTWVIGLAVAALVVVTAAALLLTIIFLAHFWHTASAGSLKQRWRSCG